ncbi:MAG TPA: type II toxin-antitoxin system PemK/MazF family toxin [Tepidisphaeraceae bacterium]|nr:type II toxin-antitoxin system PemK/MazF family toxin [Tepidisphaeraceae bacterium]
MSRQTYHPDRGDIIHLNLAPSAGQELTGPHFALVLSTIRFSKATGFCIVVPGTTKYHAEQRLAGQQLMVKLPPLMKLIKDGWLYPHQVKSLDYRDRGVSFVEKLDDDDYLIDVMERVRAFIDPDSAI